VTLRKRIIACLDVTGGRVVKGTRFVDLVDAGDPVELAARYAAEYNTPFLPVERFVEQRARVGEACEAIGRDPASLRYTAAAVVCLGADDAEYVRRATAIEREPAELRSNGVAGTPEEVLASLQRWFDAGAERMYLQVLDLADLDHLDAIEGLL